MTWPSVLHAWLNSPLTSRLLAGYGGVISKLFSALLPPCLLFVRRLTGHGASSIPVPDLQLVRSVVRMMQALTVDFRDRKVRAATS